MIGTWGGLQSVSAKGLNQYVISEYGTFLFSYQSTTTDVAWWIDRVIIIYTHFKILFIFIVKTGAKLWNRMDSLILNVP